MKEELGLYAELIKNGALIQDLLVNNSSNVGELGELLMIAAIYIEKLEHELGIE